MPNALLHAFPVLEPRLRWMPLGNFPTPVERLPALDAWVKRDDRSGHLYGGNKVRKLEFLLADAIGRGAHRVVTMGAFGSHHLLATTLYARREGLEVCGLVFPQPATQETRDTLLLSAGAGACLHPIGNLAGTPFAMATAAWKHRADARIFIPPGGSSPLGSLGYVAAALELAEQVRAGVLPRPDAIYVPFGSGGTAAGLTIGLRLAGLDRTRVFAVRVFDRLFANAHLLARLARRTAAMLRAIGGPDVGHFRASDFQVLHDQFGAGYGRVTPAARSALALAAGWGIQVDTTYSAKALAAMLARLPGDRSLFWSTLSSTALGDLSRAPLRTLPATVRRML